MHSRLMQPLQRTVSQSTRQLLAVLADTAHVLSCVLQVGGKTFMINHFEAPQPSTAYVSELAADSDGKLRIVSTNPVDDTNPE